MLDVDKYVNGKKLVDAWMKLHGFHETNIRSKKHVIVLYDEDFNEEIDIQWVYSDHYGTSIQIYGTIYDDCKVTDWVYDVESKDPLVLDKYDKDLHQLIKDIRKAFDKE